MRYGHMHANCATACAHSASATAAGAGPARVIGERYTIPERELRVELCRAAIDRLLPAYTAFYERFSKFGFSNPEKHIKFEPREIEAALRYFYQTQSDQEPRLTV